MQFCECLACVSPFPAATLFFLISLCMLCCSRHETSLKSETLQVGVTVLLERLSDISWQCKPFRHKLQLASHYSFIFGMWLLYRHVAFTGLGQRKQTSVARVSRGGNHVCKVSRSAKRAESLHALLLEGVLLPPESRSHGQMPLCKTHCLQCLPLKMWSILLFV